MISRDKYRKTKSGKRRENETKPSSKM